MSDAPPATSYTEPNRPDYAQARTALLAVIFLQIALNTHLSAGAGIFAHWLLPAAEAVLLLVLSSITTLGIRGLRRGSLSLDDYMQRHGGAPRVLAFTLIALITIANTVSLVRLVDALLHTTKATGVALLDDAANLWITNLICFSLWYWELDRGGPARRGLPNERRPDFLFTNMTAPDFCKSDWRPGASSTICSWRSPMRPGRLLPNGYAAADRPGQGRDDAASRRLFADDRPGRFPRGEHPRLAGQQGG